MITFQSLAISLNKIDPENKDKRDLVFRRGRNSLSRNIREFSGWTTQKLAKRLECSPSQVKKMETTEDRWTIKYFGPFCTITGLPRQLLKNAHTLELFVDTYPTYVRLIDALLIYTEKGYADNKTLIEYVQEKLKDNSDLHSFSLYMGNPEKYCPAVDQDALQKLEEIFEIPKGELSKKILGTAHIDKELEELKVSVFKTIQVKVEDLCKQRSLFTKDLAEIAGLPLIEVDDLLSGKRATLNQLILISKALDVPISELLQ